MSQRPRALSLSALALALAGAPITSVRAQGGAKPVVAVFDLENRAKLKNADVVTLTEYITTRLAGGGLYRVVPKGEVQSALRAKKTESYQSCYDESCQIEIGRELAAQKTLSSKVSQLGSTCIVTVQLYDLAQSASEGAGTSKGGCKVEQILALLDEAMAPLVRPAAAAVAKVAPATSAAPAASTSPAPSSPAEARAAPEAPARSEPAVAPPPEVADLPMPQPPANGAELDRLVRGLPFMRNPRNRALLVTEVQSLESLLQATSKAAPDRPALGLRLGMGYGELEFAAARDAAKGDGPAKKIENAARAGQIKHLSALAAEYPLFERGDEVLYALGLVYERAQDFKNARQVMYDLIKEFPASSRVPLAYLFFAERFRAEAKLDLADQALSEAEKFPLVAAYARYGRSWVAANQNNRAAALGHLTGARKLAEALPTTVEWRAPLLTAIDGSLRR